MDERDQKHQQVMDDSNRRLQAMRAQCSKEFETLIDEKLRVEKQARQLEAEKRQALEQAEAEKRQLRMELGLAKDLQKQEKQRLLTEVQETMQEIDQDREAHMRKLETMLGEKEKECESLKEDYETLEDETVKPLDLTINRLHTKVDALYCIAYATVPKEHQDSLQPLSGGGIDVKKRDGVMQIVDYTCGLLAGMPASHACEAATALGMAGRSDLKRQELVQKIREALSGTGPARSR